MSKVTEFKQMRSQLGHRNSMPADVRKLGTKVAKGLSKYMNNCQIADNLDVDEKSVRRWLSN